MAPTIALLGLSAKQWLPAPPAPMNIGPTQRIAQIEGLRHGSPADVMESGGGTRDAAGDMTAGWEEV
ncbi:MAG: hypothetical protein ACR2OZ_19810 [Verrucomicrobiales bacterium]